MCIRDRDDLDHKQLSENEFEFSGRTEIDLINEKYRLNIPELEEYETIGGMIIHHTESIPSKGDLISIDFFKILIKEVSKTRVELVRFIVVRSTTKELN